MSPATARSADAAPATAPEALLVELFTEELPPRALTQLGDSFAQGIASQLAAHGLAANDTHRQMFCTPRRLAVLLAQVAAQAPARAQRVKGPSVAVALDAAPSADGAFIQLITTFRILTVAQP